MKNEQLRRLSEFAIDSKTSTKTLTAGFGPQPKDDDTQKEVVKLGGHKNSNGGRGNGKDLKQFAEFSIDDKASTDALTGGYWYCGDDDDDDDDKNGGRGNGKDLNKFAEFSIDKNKQGEKLKTEAITGGCDVKTGKGCHYGNGGRGNGKATPNTDSTAK